jgi:hypothetical protein
MTQLPILAASSDKGSIALDRRPKLSLDAHHLSAATEAITTSPLERSRFVTNPLAYLNSRSGAHLTQGQLKRTTIPVTSELYCSPAFCVATVALFVYAAVVAVAYAAVSVATTTSVVGGPPPSSYNMTPFGNTPHSLFV